MTGESFFFFFIVNIEWRVQYQHNQSSGLARRKCWGSQNVWPKLSNSIFVWDAASQSAKWLDMLKILGRHGPLGPPGYAYEYHQRRCNAPKFILLDCAFVAARFINHHFIAWIFSFYNLFCRFVCFLCDVFYFFPHRFLFLLPFDRLHWATFRLNSIWCVQRFCSLNK